MDTMNLTNYQINLIGTGLKGEDTFNETNGKVLSNTGVDRLNQSICHILGTRIGERFFLPEFGSNLHELIFEPNDYILQDLLVYYISDALGKWEPRIKVPQVVPEVIAHDNVVPVNISYNIVNTNLTVNYVYPFNRSVYELGQEVDINMSGMPR